MKYVVNEELEYFSAWSCGKDNLEELKEHPEAFDNIKDYLNEVTEVCDWTEVDINDFLWFDMYDYLREEGYVDDDDNWLDEKNKGDEE